MPAPLSLVPLATAARGGSIDSLDARQLVAAGITLLQRSASLVRALALGQGAVLLPNSPAYLVALAACEGRGAVLLDPQSSPEEIARVMDASNARVVFTLECFKETIADAVPRVYLDPAPRHATFVHGAEDRVVDLGSHFGLAVEGEGDVEGSDEEAVLRCDERSGDLLTLTHRTLLSGARAVAANATFSSDDLVLAVAPFFDAAALTASLIAPLLAGARVTTAPEVRDYDLAERVRLSGATVVVGVPESYGAILAALRRERSRLEAPALRLALMVRGAAQPSLVAEWQRTTGVELRQVGSTPEFSAHRLPAAQDLGE